MEIKTIEPFLEYYERLRGRTLRVIRTIPPDRIEWTYKKGKFTFGDLIRHLAAIERYMFAENVQLEKSAYPGQIYLYLAMLDVATPPLYGLISEEFFARSIRKN